MSDPLIGQSSSFSSKCDEGILPRAKRRRKRARNDRGLPPDSDLRNLAREYLLGQRQHWPDLAASGVIPEPTEGILDGMVEDFKQRHRTSEVGDLPAKYSSRTLAGHYARFSCDNSSGVTIDARPAVTSRVMRMLRTPFASVFRLWERHDAHTASFCLAGPIPPVVDRGLNDDQAQPRRVG